MQFLFVIILEAALLASSCSIDAFAASFAYGGDKIKIPALSALIINIICSGIIGLSFLIGNLLKPYLPHWLTAAICFSVLFAIGVTKLLDGVTKSIIRKYDNLNKELKFSMLNFKFILRVYANPEEADADCSRTISPAEAAVLAVSLSLDGMAVGFGAAFGGINGLAVLLCSLVTNALAVTSGCYLGNKIAGKLPFNVSWFSGVVLIILAITKLF